MKKEELFLFNNSGYLEDLKNSKIGFLAFVMSPRIKKAYKKYTETVSTEERARQCAEVIDLYEESHIYRLRIRIINAKRKIRVLAQQKGQKTITIDCSDKRAQDYYSVAVIVKNEARYMREFVLFYWATGADRIYVYDNDSTDNLLEVLDPFIKCGFVIYRSIHGPRVQSYAYMDAVIRTRKRTKWLAIIDADEYLFSPKGDMPEQLRAYERYPGVGVNWVMYGPNGHIKRPDGLIMDNYTETYSDSDRRENHHIKSIVQPARVFSFNNPHYAIYKCRTYAVDEQGNKIGNYGAYAKRVGRAFTETHHREVFRINHYFTKSHEDLEDKCARGYADGASNRVFDEALEMFDAPMCTDYTIRKYANKVREVY